MKTFIRAVNFLALVVAMILLPGCSLFQQKIGPRIATGIKQYCIEPVEVRMLLRAEVNALIAPNSVRVECAADQVPKPDAGK